MNDLRKAAGMALETIDWIARLRPSPIALPHRWGGKTNLTNY